MNTAKICKCNQCGETLIDENPQTGAKEYELTGSELTMDYLNDENGRFWGCPICLTDEYLMDLED